MWLPIIISILSGFAIEIFFRTIRYHSDVPPQQLPPNHKVFGSYITLSEFLSGDNNRLVNYMLFRYLPPTLILVFSMSLYRRYFQIYDPLFLLITSSVTSLLPRDIVCIFKKNQFLTEKFFHLLNIINIVAISIILSFSYKYLDYSYIAPSREGLVDNLWSSLLVALILIIYFETTRQNKTVDEEYLKINQNNYIIKSYHKLLSKFGKQIEIFTTVNNTYKPLLYSILIYENMNRPEWLRYIEKFLVKRLKIGMTVGIAQVYSKKPLTDIESIKEASTIMKNSKEIFSNKIADNENKKRDLIKLYNNDKRYYQSIISIMSVLEDLLAE